MGLFDRLFGRSTRPTLVCSRCYTMCSGSASHVVPWWNETVGDFTTTYRCDGCWVASLDETTAKVQGWDNDARDKFCEFLGRHRMHQIAEQVRAASLPEATHLVVKFLDMLRRGEHRLLP